MVACAATATALALTGAADADAAVPASLHDPAKCRQIGSADATAIRCDDGVPAQGGRTPNPGGAFAVTVPAAYGAEGEDGYTGLPHPSPQAADEPGADAGGTVALDVDVTLPTSPPPEGGYPLMLLTHGCCTGNKASSQRSEVNSNRNWHASDLWHAARGYVVVTWTSRGFMTPSGRGSTGEFHFNSRLYEVNDLQHIACQMIVSAPDFGDATGHEVEVDPARIVVGGGSAGGALSWMAMTDPEWDCSSVSGGSGPIARLAAVTPLFGWTDLAYAFLPTGTHSIAPGALPDVTGCDSAARSMGGVPCGGPARDGIAKGSLLPGLVADEPGIAAVHRPYASFMRCASRRYPLDGACAELAAVVLPEWMRDSSPYFQNHFFEALTRGADPVPVFSLGSTTDVLVSSVEHRRMVNRLLSVDPGYPLEHLEDDLGHLTQPKSRMFADLCGSSRHNCEDADYPNGLMEEPVNRARVGIATRINRFLDDHVGPAFHSDPTPGKGGIESRVQVCRSREHRFEFTADESGPPVFGLTPSLQAPATLEIDYEGPGVTTLPELESNPHAEAADPLVNAATNGQECVAEHEVAGRGVASFASDPLPVPIDVVGGGELVVSVRHLTRSGEITPQLHVRIYDLTRRRGSALLVDRGISTRPTINGAQVQFRIPLLGNSWRFHRGSRVRIELSQDERPLLPHTPDSSPILIDSAQLVLRTSGATAMVEGAQELLRGKCANLQLGSSGPDALIGSRWGDDLRGMGAADDLRGRGRGDCLRGGIEDDRLAGGRGRDDLRGGRGDDRLSGGRAGDRLLGGGGRDLLMGGRGPDRIDSRDGRRDKVRCGLGRDQALVDAVDRVIGCERRAIARRTG